MGSRVKRVRSSEVRQCGDVRSGPAAAEAAHARGRPAAGAALSWPRRGRDRHGGDHLEPLNQSCGTMVDRDVIAAIIGTTRSGHSLPPSSGAFETAGVSGPRNRIWHPTGTALWTPELFDAPGGAIASESGTRFDPSADASAARRVAVKSDCAAGIEVAVRAGRHLHAD